MQDTGTVIPSDISSSLFTNSTIQCKTKVLYMRCAMDKRDRYIEMNK